MKQLTFILTILLTLCLFACNDSQQSKSGKTSIVEAKEYIDSTDFARIQQVIDEDEKRETHGAAASLGFPTNQDLVGYGFNSSTLTVTGKVVENDNTLFDTTAFSAGGQEVVKTLERVTSKSNLYNKLGVDIKASVKYGAYKGSASLQMLDESSVNSYSDYLLLKVTVTNGPLILRESKLTSPARMNATDKKVFFERYGNEYFYGKVTGGEFCCLFEFSTTSSSSKKSIKAGIDFAVKTMFASGSFSMAMERLNTALDEKTTTKIKFYRLGDEGKLASDNIDSLVKYANDFPERVKNNGGKPVVLKLLSKPILYIDDLPSNFKSSDFLVFNKQNYFLDSLSKEISKVQDINSDYKYAIDKANQEYFSPTAIDSAKLFLDLNNKSIDKMKQLFLNCITSIQYCNTSKESMISYETYIPKSTIEESTNTLPVQESKDVVLKNEEVLLISVPFGITKTIEFRGQWKMNKTNLPLDHDAYNKDRLCEVPSFKKLIIVHEERKHDPSSGRTQVRQEMSIPIQARVKIIQKNISTDQLIDETLWDGLKPFTTRTGVKVYAKPEYPITQCTPPVTAYVY